MEYKEPTTEFNYTPLDDFKLDREEVIDEVNKIFNYPNYKLIYYDFASENEGAATYVYGRASCLKRQIEINPNVSGYMFTFNLTHELVHLVYYTGSERFCNYKSFCLLHENENLKDVCNWYVNMELSNNIPYEYSCLGYIEEYLRGE